MRSFPFLKWAGGKRWLSSYAAHLAPRSYNTYVEPFLGGGAMFGAIAPEVAVLSDVNRELINCYKVIKDEPSRLFSSLSEFQKSHSKDFYYEVRDANSKDDFDRALRFIYLNRSCFNGLYRVNREGKFNVPKGTKDNIIFPYDDFCAVSKLLKGADLRHGDFETVVDGAVRDDFLFCDPPYTVAHNNNGFVRYNEQMFSWSDQVRLRDALVRASRRGVKILLTNAAHSSIEKLYAPLGFECRGVGRQSVIGGGNKYRGEYAEFLISNYPLPIFLEDGLSDNSEDDRPGILEI